MPEINLYTYKKFHNKPDDIKWGNNHDLMSAAGKVGNCSVRNIFHTFQMRYRDNFLSIKTLKENERVDIFNYK